MIITIAIIVANNHKPNDVNELTDCPRRLSKTFVSFANRWMIRPSGVVSKNACRVFKTEWNNFRCNVVAARKDATKNAKVRTHESNADTIPMAAYVLMYSVSFKPYLYSVQYASHIGVKTEIIRSVIVISIRIVNGTIPPNALKYVM